MAEVKILIEGYLEGGTCPTITLVKDKDIVMVVDPGTLKDPELLTLKLKENGLEKDDVNMVCITHSHMDHYRNIGMFSKAKALDYWGLWYGDRLKEDLGSHFTDDIQIIKTPGHNFDGITLLVSTKDGVVAICGDVFWKKDFPKDDPYASDKKKLIKSRQRVLESADYVVPGHGPMFKLSKS